MDNLMLKLSNFFCVIAKIALGTKKTKNLSIRFYIEGSSLFCITVTKRFCVFTILHTCNPYKYGGLKLQNGGFPKKKEKKKKLCRSNLSMRWAHLNFIIASGELIKTDLSFNICRLKGINQTSHHFKAFFQDSLCRM